MSITPEFIAWLAILTGVFARVMLPYLRKMWQGKLRTFDNYYLLVGFSGLVLSAIVSFNISPILVAGESFYTLFTANFINGFGSTSLINEVFAFGKEKKSTPIPR